MNIFSCIKEKIEAHLKWSYYKDNITYNKGADANHFLENTLIEKEWLTKLWDTHYIKPHMINSFLSNPNITSTLVDTVLQNKNFKELKEIAQYPKISDNTISALIAAPEKVKLIEKLINATPNSLTKQHIQKMIEIVMEDGLHSWFIGAIVDFRTNNPELCDDNILNTLCEHMYANIFQNNSITYTQYVTSGIPGYINKITNEFVSDIELFITILPYAKLSKDKIFKAYLFVKTFCNTHNETTELLENVLGEKIPEYADWPVEWLTEMEHING